MCGDAGVREISESLVQICCEPKTALKILRGAWVAQLAEHRLLVLA